jgi:hypothetical protein
MAVMFGRGIRSERPLIVEIPKKEQLIENLQTISNHRPPATDEEPPPIEEGSPFEEDF